MMGNHTQPMEEPSLFSAKHRPQRPSLSVCLPRVCGNAIVELSGDTGMWVGGVALSSSLVYPGLIYAQGIPLATMCPCK